MSATCFGAHCAMLMENSYHLSKPSAFCKVVNSGLLTEYDVNHYYYYEYYRYSALGLVWAETRAQSGDWYGSGMLHPRQVLRGSLPLLSPM